MMESQTGISLYEFITSQELMDCAHEISKELNARIKCLAEEDGSKTIALQWESGATVAIRTLNPAMLDNNTVETDEFLLQGRIQTHECPMTLLSKIDNLNKAYPDIKLYTVSIDGFEAPNSRTVCIERHFMCSGGVSIENIAFSIRQFTLRYREINNHYFSCSSRYPMH